MPSLRRLPMTTSTSSARWTTNSNEVTSLSFDTVLIVTEEKTIQKVESKLSILEQEIIELKNKGKNSLISRTQMMQGGLSPGNGIGMSSGQFAEKFDVLVEEVN